jgi:hypothetical protein
VVVKRDERAADRGGDGQGERERPRPRQYNHLFIL